MGKRVAWILTGAIGLLAAASLMRSGPAAPKLQLNGPKLDWSLVTLDDQTVSSASQAGKVAVIEFWATWCPPCQAQVPHLKDLNEKYRDRGVTFISVSIDQNRDAQKQFVAVYGMDWIQANDYDQANSLAQRWGVTSIPQTLVFAGDGRLLWQGHPMDLDGVLAQAVGSRQ